MFQSVVVLAVILAIQNHLDFSLHRCTWSIKPEQVAANPGVFLRSFVVASPDCTDKILYTKGSRVQYQEGGKVPYSVRKGPSLSGDGTLVACLGEDHQVLLCSVSGNSHPELVSRSVHGGHSNGPSGPPRLSIDGRWVVFASAASDLVAGDFNNQVDVFLADRFEKTMIRIQHASREPNGPSQSPAIAETGDIVFASAASNLAEDLDLNGLADIFVWQRSTGTIARIHLKGLADECLALDAPDISGDGRYVVYRACSWRNEDGKDHHSDIVLTKLEDKSSERILSVLGLDPISCQPGYPSISRDGGIMCFGLQEYAVDDSLNTLWSTSILVYDTERKESKRIGCVGRSLRVWPAVSPSGKYVAWSLAVPTRLFLWSAEDSTTKEFELMDP